jgi:hypothetical protein
MAKDILACFGLLSLTFVIVLGVIGVGLFYDQLGLVDLPKQATELLLRPTEPVRIVVEEQGGSRPQWSNPLDALPTATLAQIPTATALPVPPLEPAVYRAEVMFRLKSFSSAMQRWLDLNQRVADEAALLHDAAWQREMEQVLMEVSATGRALAEIGPAPDDYRQIHTLLDQVGQNAAGLRASYLEGMRSGETRHYNEAGENFERIRYYLGEAVQEMIRLGWSLE